MGGMSRGGVRDGTTTDKINGRNFYPVEREALYICEGSVYRTHMPQAGLKQLYFTSYDGKHK
jgi:hypothetical protein